MRLDPQNPAIQPPVNLVEQREANRTSLPTRRALGRIVLFSFLLTFILARVIVFLIMSHRLPDLFFLHVGGTHIHHLNCGIFLLMGVGAYLLFGLAKGRQKILAAAIYGVGVGSTFDEFSMWVRLGGSYWQRASLDAVGVLAAVFGLIAYAPKLRDFRSHHWWVSAGMAVAVAVLFIMLIESFPFAHKIIGPKLYELEAGSPP